MKRDSEKPARGSTKNLVAGVLFLCLTGILITGLLALNFTSGRTYENRSFEQLLAELPDSPIHRTENSSVSIIRQHSEALIPQLGSTLNGPPPMHFRITSKLPGPVRNSLLRWLPSDVTDRLFITAEDVKLRRQRSLHALSLVANDHPKTILQIMIQALARRETSLRRAAIQSIGEFGSEAHTAVPRLTPFLTSSDSNIRFQTAKTLGLIGPDSQTAIGKLKTLMSDRSEMVRGAAVVAYSRIVIRQDKLSVELRDAITDSSSHVRYAAAQAIGRTACQDPNSASLLIQALKDTESQVRRNAAIALGKMGPIATAAIDPLIAALWDETMEVRISSAEALGEIGPKAKRAIPHLFDALNNDFAGMGTPAHEAIKKIDPASDQGISAR